MDTQKPTEREAGGKPVVSPVGNLTPEKRLRMWQAAGPLITLAGVTFLGYGIYILPEPYRFGESANISMLYLIATVFGAMRWGLIPGIMTAIGGFLLSQLVFRAQGNLSNLNAPNEIINLLIFLGAAATIAFIGSLPKQKQEQEKLRGALKEERRQHEQDELRSILLASVTHDLKTPLAAIIGSLSSLRHIPILSASAKRQLIVTAHEEARRLDGFISNILSMTKLESGAISPEKDWYQPAAIAHCISKRLQEHAPDRPIIVNAPSAAIEFLVDRHLIEQVLQNLVDNAVKYGAPESPITIDVAMENGKGTIMVTNEGKIIPFDASEKIFDKFYRTGTRDNTIAGAGLGLAICRTIMEMHGGSIDLSKPDRVSGACFILTFQQAREAVNIADRADRRETRYA